MKTFGKHIKINGLGFSRYRDKAKIRGGVDLILETTPEIDFLELADRQGRVYLASADDAFQRYWDPEGYEKAVQFHLRKLSMSRVGKIILASIRESIEIIPYALEIRNADADRNRIRFTPVKFLAKRQSQSLALGVEEEIRNGVTATSILLHEVVHSLSFQLSMPRDMWGETNTYDELYEFVAILVANTFRSEEGFEQKRLSHQDLRTSGISAYNFLSDARNEDGMLKFLIYMPKVFHAISAVPVKWNPCRLYLNQFSRMTQ